MGLGAAVVKEVVEVVVEVVVVDVEVVVEERETSCCPVPPTA
jgi:hypothetical protein